MPKITIKAYMHHNELGGEHLSGDDIELEFDIDADSEYASLVLKAEDWVHLGLPHDHLISIKRADLEALNLLSERSTREKYVAEFLERRKERHGN